VRRAHGGRDRDVRDPRFAHDALIGQVDLEDAPQPREHDEHAVLQRQGAARQAAARSARHPRHAGLVAGTDDGGHLLARAREHGDAGDRRVLQQSVGLVGPQRMVLGDDVLVATDAPQLLDQAHTTIQDRTDVLCR
jgi:hypothetical protein